MHIFELCDYVRLRPGIYVDGEKSMMRLRSFLVGYEAGVGYQAEGRVEEYKLTGSVDMRNFCNWVSNNPDYACFAGGWCGMIQAKAGSDEKAFDLFFELLDEYRADVDPRWRERADGNQ
jgi:hypothetical protein